ncbi:MAG: OsmC family protein [Candidatus Dormibacteria bacterium]|jgi:organic hydroperoxide reductase OsmC/OhrA
MRDHIHRYRTELTWRGSTGGGYAAYDRTHQVDAPPAGVRLRMSADPAFRGNPELPNPEQLLLAAASSCQLLSFLSLVAREGIDVVSYEDSAEAVMPDDDKPVRITGITLRPRVVLASGAAERVRALLVRAHHDCFIANSINAEITLEPEILRADGSSGLEPR